MTEGSDIGLHVFYTDNNNGKEGAVELVPFARIESHLVMEEGEIICEAVGKCNVQFRCKFYVKDAIRGCNF